MSNYQEIQEVTLIAILAIMSPGPGFAIVVRNSLAYGRRSGIATASGNACGDLTLAILNVLGLGFLLAQLPSLMDVLRISGCLYLSWLGVRGLLSKKGSFEDISSAEEQKDFSSGFLSGFLTTLLNPKAFIFLFAVFAVVVSQETPDIQRAFYGGWIGFLSLSWFVLVAFFFTKQKVRGTLLSYRHWLERLTGIILIIFAFKLLWLSPLEGTSVLSSSDISQERM